MTSKQFRPALFALLGVSVLASCGGSGSTGSTSVALSDNPERFVRDAIAPDGSRITGASCVSTGTVAVNETIVVKKGKTYDGDCRTFQVKFGNGSQDEGQPPVFRLEDDATLKNVIIGDNGADGVHTYGDVTIDNLTWMDVGEDALTIKKKGTVIVRNIDGFDASDKFFQINAPSTLRVDNCVIKNAEKGLQQNGGTTFKIDVSFNRCHLIDINRSVFHTIEGTKSVAKLSNSITDNVKRVCEGVWDKCTVTDSSEPPGDDSGGSGGTGGGTGGSGGGTGGSGGSIGPGSEDSIQEGESGYCSADSLIESDHSGYEGIGFVNTENSRGVTVEWQVKVNALAQYNVSVRYANGSNANRGGTLIANGDSRDTAVYDLGRTGAWTNWTSESQLITLQKGSNRLVLRADTSSGLANIDSIRIAGGKGAKCSDGDSSTGGSTGGDSGGGGSSGGDSGGGGSSGGDTGGGGSSGGDTGGGGSSGGDTGGGSSDNRTLTIEDDETGFCRMDGAIESEHNGYKGDGFLNTDNENGAAIEWQVNSDAANNYDIRIRFANGGNSKRDGTLTVNNNSGSAVVYDFGGTGGWDRWSNESRSIVLQAGSNRIVLQARTSAGLPNIDSIRISGESPSAGDCSDSGGTGGGSGGGSGSGNSSAEVKLNNGRWVATAAGSTVYNGNRFFDAVNAAIDNQNGGTINIRDSGKSGSDGGEVYAIKPRSGQTLNFNNKTVTADGGELVIPVFCDRRDDITIRNLRVKGNPRYGVWFKGCSDITLENISMDLDRDNPVGLGIRVDASSGPASNLTIKGDIDINGSKTHAIETYGIDGFEIGDVTVTNSGGAGLLLNDSRNGRVGKVVGRNNDPDGGYATFRVANDNGPNVEVESVYSRNSGRGFFSVSDSRGTTVRYVDIADTNKQGILLQNARDTRVLDGVVSNGNPNCQMVDSDSSRLDVDGC